MSAPARASYAAVAASAAAPAPPASPPPALDPYYLVKDSIQAALGDAARERAWLESNPLAGAAGAGDAAAHEAALRSLQAAVEGADFQLHELSAALATARGDPQRFKLDGGEIQARQAFVERSRRGADELRGFMEREATKAAAAAAAAARERARNAAAREIEAATEGGGTAAGLPDDYSGNGGGDPGGINVDARLQQHDRLIEWQDEQLDDLVVSVAKVGQMGRTIGEELGSQAEMLNELDGHLDSTGARVRAASRKIEKLIRGSKGCQLGIIVFLLVLLISLIVLISG